MGKPKDPRLVLAETFAAARAAADVDAMADAAISLAGLARFGDHAGRVPALLYDAYEAAADRPRLRVRLAAALARAWVYGYDAARGAPFAEEAVRGAESLGDRALLADALDAALATRWGPDDLAERLHITAALQDVAAHLDDPDARLQAHLWRLTTALENLDTVGVQRQLAALDVLADEIRSPVARFFAASRRAMHALLVNDVAAAEALLSVVQEAGEAGEVADSYFIDRVLTAEIARQRGDAATLRREALTYETYGTETGIPSIVAEAAALWLDAGDADGAARLVARLAPELDALPRDVDWLLTVTRLVEAAVGIEDRGTAQRGAVLLAPYAGRAVVNAGAVNFHGVVDDYLARAAAMVGNPAATDLRAAAAAAYRRLGAGWWLRRVAAPPVAATRSSRSPTLRLYPLPGQAAWRVGGGDAVVPDMRGLHYLRLLLARPGVEVAAADLVAAVAGHAPLPPSDAGEALDRRALAAYRQRLADLAEEVDEARACSDPERGARLEQERAVLLAEVRRAVGLHGRPRRSGSSDERARTSVRKAIAAALERVESLDAGTARVLRRCVRTGAACVYAPDPDQAVEWLLGPALEPAGGAGVSDAETTALTH